MLSSIPDNSQKAHGNLEDLYPNLEACFRCTSSQVLTLCGTNGHVLNDICYGRNDNAGMYYVRINLFLANTN